MCTTHGKTSATDTVSDIGAYELVRRCKRTPPSLGSVCTTLIAKQVVWDVTTLLKQRMATGGTNKRSRLVIINDLTAQFNASRPLIGTEDEARHCRSDGT